MKLVFSILFLLTAVLFQAQDQDVLRYDVRVNVRVVPIFALDANDNPVFDLKKEDFDFFINGKRTELSYILFRGQQSSVREEAPTAAPHPGVSDERLVFLVLDFFNLSRRNELRLKTITREIVGRARPMDLFAVIGIMPRSGLQVLAGPEKGGPDLFKKIDNLKNKRISMRGMPPFVGPGGPGDTTDAELGSSLGAWVGRPYSSAGWGSEQARSLQYFKHALKTFVQPKVVYFISMGVPVTTDSQFHLKRMADAFREGGAVVFTINPAQFTSSILGDSLRYIAEENGGRYYQDNQVERIVEQVVQTSSAYYEAVFDQGSVDPAREYRIRIECRRPGLRILVPGAITETKRYSDMSAMEKELFAADIIGGGLWSKWQATVRQPPFVAEKIEIPDGNRFKVTVTIPGEMVGSDADCFLIQLRSDQADARLKKSVRHLKPVEHFEISGQPGEELHFVIIDPATRLCLASRIDQPKQ